MCFKNKLQINVPYFCCYQLNDLNKQKFPKQQLIYFPQKPGFNNGHLEIVAQSSKNKKPNVSAYFEIISKFLFTLCSLIKLRSFLDIRFLLGGIYVLEALLPNSSALLNTDFWGILKENLLK